MGNASGASKLRHGCKSVMIDETSCLEFAPVYDEEASAENIDGALEKHASAEYTRLVSEQWVDPSSGYPACVSASAADDSSDDRATDDRATDDRATDDRATDDVSTDDDVVQSSSTSIGPWRCAGLVASVLTLWFGFDSQLQTNKRNTSFFELRLILEDRNTNRRGQPTERQRLRFEKTRLRRPVVEEPVDGGIEGAAPSGGGSHGRSLYKKSISDTWARRAPCARREHATELSSGTSLR